MPLLGLVVGYYLLVAAFIMGMHVKHLWESGTKFTLFWKVAIIPWAVVGISLDIAFNVVCGTLMYLELPHELMFTARCKRHKADPKWRGEVARWWARQLNQIEPGHV
jgi:hypothetical protein